MLAAMHPPPPPRAPADPALSSKTETSAPRQPSRRPYGVPPPPPLAAEARYRASPRFRAALFESLQTSAPAQRATALAGVRQVCFSWADSCYPKASVVVRRTSSTLVPRTSSPGASPGPASESPPPPLLATPADSSSSLSSGAAGNLLTRSVSAGAAARNAAAHASAAAHSSSSLSSASGILPGSPALLHRSSSLNTHTTTGPVLASVPRRLGSLSASSTPPPPGGSSTSGGGGLASVVASMSDLDLTAAALDHQQHQQHQHHHQGGGVRGNNGEDDDEADDPRAETRALLHLHVLTLLRLASTCPYADVRTGLRTVLHDLVAEHPALPVPRPVHPSPSYFIARHQLVPLPAATDHEAYLAAAHGRIGYGTPADVRGALTAAFHASSTARVDHTARVLAYFPRYLRKAQAAHAHAVRDMPGPLPATWRLYASLMGAAQMRNVAVAGRSRAHFLHVGGYAEWLTQGTRTSSSTLLTSNAAAGSGGDSNAEAAAVPPKLAALAPFNAILAHQPWRLRADHVARLVAGHGWSAGELVHAVVVLASAHAQSSMAFGMGILPDIDVPGGAVFLARDVDDDLVDDSTAPAAIGLGLHTAPPSSLLVTMTPQDEMVSLDGADPAPLSHDGCDSPAITDAAVDDHLDAVTSGLVSPAELSLTDQLIAKLREQSTATGSDDEESATGSGDQEPRQRRELFENCEAQDMANMSDSETDRDLMPPHAEQTFLQSIPPPLPPFSDHDNAPPVGGTGGDEQRDGDKDAPISLGTWWSKPGAYPALDADDISRLTVQFTVPGADCDGVSGHQDFDVKAPEYSVMRLTDWNWEDHGQELVGKYLGAEMSELLDDEFEEARHMTIYSVFSAGDVEDDDDGEYDSDSGEIDSDGGEDISSISGTTPRSDHGGSTAGAMAAPTAGPTPSVGGSSVGVSGIDTAPFREAIWYYTLRLFGIATDDYDYRMVNHFLNKRTKSFVKKVATSPHTLTFRDWARMGVVLRPEEKAHVVVLVAEARKMAELVWALSAIVKYVDGGRSRSS
ncbi:PA26 p53-induced protein-domain-containing protein [Blastocladiella britannica]|nr:PA26 p53-induced protein-domain-containing protein [Blastocladiella britannica]